MDAETVPTEVETVPTMRAPRDSNPQPSVWEAGLMSRLFRRGSRAAAQARIDARFWDIVGPLTQRQVQPDTEIAPSVGVE